MRGDVTSAAAHTKNFVKCCCGASFDLPRGEYTKSALILHNSPNLSRFPYSRASEYIPHHSPFTNMGNGPFSVPTRRARGRVPKRYPLRRKTVNSSHYRWGMGAAQMSHNVPFSGLPTPATWGVGKRPLVFQKRLCLKPSNMRNTPKTNSPELPILGGSPWQQSNEEGSIKQVELLCSATLRTRALLAYDDLSEPDEMMRSEVCLAKRQLPPRRFLYDLSQLLHLRFRENRHTSIPPFCVVIARRKCRRC